MTTVPRVEQLSAPAVRQLAKGAPPDAIDLGLGQPGWALPEPARQALAAAGAEAAPCPYGPNDGLPALVEAVADHHRTDPGRVMVTHGAQGALFALFQAHVGPGQRVLVPDPGFPGYRTLATLCGGEVVPYRLGPRGRLDPDALGHALQAAAADGDVAMVVLNHPSNPTGGGATPEALAEATELAARHGALVVSDEVYRELHLGHPDRRQASLHDVTDEGVVVSSVSKAWAAPGLRVGWAVARPDLLASARLVHAAMTTAPARPSQLAAAALLRESATVLAESCRQLIRRWSVAQTGPHPVAAAVTPAGGFYHWLELPAWALEDPMAFCVRLRDEGLVTVVPGSAFGNAGNDHVRISCGGDPRQLAEGLRRLDRFWRAP